MAKKKPGQNIFNKNHLNLKEIKPLTPNQEKLFKEYQTGSHMFISGCPGTGKSFLSIYNALKEMTENNNYKKLLIMRSVVPSRDIGFLPGSAEEKAAIYEVPYVSILADLFGRADAYEILKKELVIDFMTTSFLRGITFKDCILIVDESQNMTFEELNTVISRVGENCKIIFSGDFFQTDLNKKKNDRSGFIKFKNILGMIPEFKFVTMNIEDIVRSLLVKKYIIARIKYEDQYEPLDS